MSKIRTVKDSKRGCGWRKPGGLYLRADGLGAPCGKLPVPLQVCPCCGSGYRPGRGWRWFEPKPVFALLSCELSGPAAKLCNVCPCGGGVPDKAGLLWIGEAFYTPDSFQEEARRLGVSRRITSVPLGFELGKTWVYVAHRHVPINGKEVAAIFHAFRPTAIEYITTGKESAKDIDALIKRGITPVKVLKVGVTQEMNLAA